MCWARAHVELQIPFINTRVLEDRSGDAQNYCRPFVVLMIHNTFWHLLFAGRQLLIAGFVLWAPLSHTVAVCDSARADHGILFLWIFGVFQLIGRPLASDGLSSTPGLCSVVFVFSGFYGLCSVLSWMKIKNPNQRGWQTRLPCIPCTPRIPMDCREFYEEEECKTEHTVKVFIFFV